MLFFEHEGGKAVIDGKWKLLARRNSKGWQLYDLSNDLSESTDLASQYPKKIQHLTTAWQNWYSKMKTYIAANKSL